MSYHIQPDGRIQAEGITLYTTAGGINHSLLEVHPNDVTDVSQSVSATLGPLLAHTQLQNLAVTGGPTGVVVPPRTSLPPLSISVPVSQRSLGTADDTNNDSPPKKKPQILEKMKELRDQGKYCDVTIDVKGVRFRAHKNVLAAWSPYFDLHLSDVFGPRDLLIVHYDNYEVFSDLLDFLYTGRIAPRETNFLQLLHLAVSFQIELLQNDCEEYLRSNLHLGNFTTTYFLSRKYRIHSLEKFVVGFLQMNLSDAVKQNEFLSLTFGQFHCLLSGNCMEQVKPEIKLFLIISWVGFEVRKRERYLVMLLKHIDWTTVASDFLLEISRTENFFTTHESSLYLLLQTLFSSSISLGPYVELFPALRLTYSHILNDIVDSTGAIPPKGDDYCPVTVTASCNITNKTDCSVNTDVTGPDIEAAMPETYSSVPEDPGRLMMRMTMTRELESNYDDRGYYPQDNNNDTYVNEPSNVTNTVENNTEEIQENTTIKRKTKCKKIKLIMPVPPEGKKCVKNLKNTKKQSLRRSSRRRIKKRHYEDSLEEEEEEGQTREVDDADNSLHEDEQPSNHENIEKDVDENIEDEEMEAGSPDAEDDEEEEEEEDLDDDDDDDEPEELDQNTASGETGQGEKTESKNSQKKKRTKRKINSDQTYKCTHKNCKYATSKKSTLRKHYDREHIITEYMCNICNLRLEFTRDYKKHMRKHFDGPPFKCDYPGCNYQNETFMPMISHRMRHTDDRPFKCDQCSMSFRTRNNLTQHKAIHTEKSIPCPVCKKLFLFKNTMEQHLVTHSDDRPYLCDLCGFSTKYQSHLATHKRRHTGDVYPCTFPNCTYTTPKKCQLKSHMRFHLQIRNYHCETCGRAFIEKSHLNRHMRSHNVVELEMCSFCPYRTTRKDKMKEHFKRYHGDNPTAKGPYRVRKSRLSQKGETTQFHVLPESCKFDHAYTMQPPLQLDPSTTANRIFQEIQGQQLVMPPGQNIPVSQLTVTTVTLPVSISQSLRDPEDIHNRLVATSTPGSVAGTTLVSSPITPPHDDITPGTDMQEHPDARTVLHETNNTRSLLQSLEHHRSIMQETADHQTVLQEDDHQSYIQQVHMPQSSSGAVTLSQGMVNQAFTSQANQPQQTQNPDYGGLNAFMALF